jgi:hypothetical protein
MVTSIAENVDEKGILKIRNLISRYGLKDFLQAVELEMCDIVGNTGKEEEEHQIATRWKSPRTYCRVKRQRAAAAFFALAFLASALILVADVRPPRALDSRIDSVFDF